MTDSYRTDSERRPPPGTDFLSRSVGAGIAFSQPVRWKLASVGVGGPRTWTTSCGNGQVRLVLLFVDISPVWYREDTRQVIDAARSRLNSGSGWPKLCRSLNCSTVERSTHKANSVDFRCGETRTVVWQIRSPPGCDGCRFSETREGGGLKVAGMFGGSEVP